MNPPAIKNIFLADDDSDDIYIFRQALEEVNIQVQLHTAKDGAAFMNLLNSAALKPDLVFLDLNMPLKNGLICLEEIRSNRHFETLPVAIFSTSNDEAMIEKAYARKANAFIAKPSVFSQLKQVINMCLQRNWADGSPPARENFLIIASN